VSDGDRDGLVEEGDQVTYRFRAVNSGTATLYRLRLVDARLGRLGLSVRCEASTLAPGQSAGCTAQPLRVTRFLGRQGVGRNFGFATAVAADGGTIRSNGTATALGVRADSASDVPQALPRTGTSVAGPAWLAGLLLLTGAGLIQVGRRIRPTVTGGGAGS
jgi:hypothetical protein